MPLCGGQQDELTRAEAAEKLTEGRPFYIRALCLMLWMRYDENAKNGK